MTSPLLERSVSGTQAPSRLWVPETASSAGQETIDLARAAGLTMDPWQEFVLRGAMGERPDGRWQAVEVGVEVSRQNGKCAILVARELAGLFLFGEELQIHSAHQFDTSLEAFRRLLFLIEEHDDFSRRVKRVSKSHGEEGIELTNGQRIRFRTRTKGGGRGFSGDTVYLDEAMDIALTAHGALMPTLSARPNPQVWYLGSAVDQNVHEHGLVFSQVRARGIKGGDPELAFFGWEAASSMDEAEELLDDRQAWADANPALGIRITEEFIALERRSMAARTFMVERLGVGDWPRLEEEAEEGTLTIGMWEACEDPDSKPLDPVRLAVDVRPDRSKSAIAIAGYTADGRRHVELVEHKSGTDWVAERAHGIQKRHGTGPILLDTKSPAAALLPQFAELGAKIAPVTTTELAQGCGMLFDDVAQRDLVHRGQPQLATAVRGAAKRPLGDAWAWSRKSSQADISPLVAVTLARWGLGEKRKGSEPLVAWR
jgi:hypothetical protein